MVAAFVALVAFQTAEGADTRPNIVVFLSDDMGWGQPGFNGGTEVATPNIDRIAEEGVKLTQFYVQPVCSATRAALLTGRYPWKNGMEIRTSVRAANGMLLDERTIAEALRDADYAPWIVGKWHLGQWRDEHLPLQRGFDHHYGFYSARVDSFTLRRHVILDWHRNGRPVVENGYATFLLVDEAVQLINRHDGSHPFFLYVAFGAVHSPHVAPAEYVEKYSHLSNRRQLAMLDAMDVAMGRVIAALEAKDALDDTLLVFLNDNGASGEGNMPYRASKGSYYEGGILSPAALRWPGRIPAGSESDALLHVVDLFPTLAGLAGAEPDADLPLDGLDAWEAIAEGAESPRTEVVHSLDVIREGDWKLLEEDATYYTWSADTLQLYNIREDPYEQTNLAATETAKVAELRERLAYHRPFEREAETYEEIPRFPPVIYGKTEQEAFGTHLKIALRLRDAGIPGPTLVRVEAFADRVRLVYDRAVDADSVPPTSAFKLVENPGYQSVEVTEVNVTGSAILLTPGQSLRAGETVGVTYEVPATGAIQDSNGLEAVGVTWVTASPTNILPISNDATLSALTLSGIDVGTFAPSTTAYAATVPLAVSNTTVTATRNDADATLTIADAAGSTAGGAREVSLSNGANSITITVTAADGETTATYTVTVTRLTQDLAEVQRRSALDFDDLSDNVPFGLWSDGATLWSAAWWSGGLVAFDLDTQGRLSAQDIATASDNPSPTGLWSDGVTLWASDYDGGVYAYRLEDGARLPGEDIAAALEEAGNDTPTGLWSDGTTLWVADHFDAHVYAYRLEDGARDRAREFALADGTKAYGLWSDGTTVWTADFADGRVQAYRLANGRFDASRGYNTSSVGNSAPVSLWSDGETLWVGDRSDEKLYAYAMSALDVPVLSGNATLSALSLSGVEVGSFASGTTSYSATVANEVATTTVTVTPTDAAATVAIADPHGSTAGASRTVNLDVGDTAITVTVIAEDGQTTQTYAVTVTRAMPSPSNDATLKALALSGLDIGTFDAAMTDYAATAAESAAATTVTATPNDGRASVVISDADGSTSGTAREVALGYGSNTITATVTAADGETTRAYTATVTRAYTLPTARIAATTSPVSEGTDASFKVSLDKAAKDALTVAVSLSETAAALSGSGSSVVIAKGETGATLTVGTVDDSVVEEASTVTAALAAGDGYAVGTADSAEVLVEDDDAATFAVAAGLDTIEEGDATTVSVSVANGVTFATDQTVTLTVSGTAASDDYALSPTSMTLAAGNASVSATLTATDDEAEEQDETVTVSASHGGTEIGTATVMIAANDAALSDDATLSALTLSGVDIGTFDAATTDYAVDVAHDVERTTVTATPNDADATVVIQDADGPTPGTARDVEFDYGKNTVTAKVTAADDVTTTAYTVTVTRPRPPLTASLHQVPARHDGTSDIEFELRFSEEIALSYVTLKAAYRNQVDGGTLLYTRRAAPPGNVRWRVGVKPSDDGAVVATLPGKRPCGTAGAICAADGRMLSNSPVARIPGPLPTVSIGSDGSSVSEGTAAAFALMRTGDAAGELTVAVTVAETGATVAGNAPAEATFAAGASAAALSVATDNDAVAEASSTVTAAVAAGTGYAVSADAGSAEVVVEDDDAATFAVGLSPATLAEGASATLTVSITNGVAFAETQTMEVAASGTASASDYALSADGDVLTAPYALTLAAGASATTATLSATDDAETEAEETLTLTASHGGTEIGTATATIAASDAALSDDATLSALTLSGVDIGTFDAATTDYAATAAEAVARTTVAATPADADAGVVIQDADGTTSGTARDVELDYGKNTVTATVTAADGETTKAYTVTVTREYTVPTATIAATTSPVPEGTDAAFKVSLDKAAKDALTVAVSLSESGDALSGSGSSVAIAKGETEATLTVGTVDDSVVEEASTVTAALAAGDGYAVGTADAAEVVVEDDDAATFAVAAASDTIEEGDATTVTVSVANGTTFATDQTVTLTASGTAASDDYALSPTSMTLAAGDASVSATLTATDDEAEEQDETVTVSASHGGTEIGAATVTIAANDAALSDDATLAALTLSGIGIGTFEASTTAYSADVDNAVESTTVTATPNDADAAVTISDADGSTAGTTRTTRLAEGANAISAGVTAADGETTATYTVEVTRAASDTATWGERLPGKDIDLSAADRPSGLGSDGETLWAADWDTSAVVAYALADGARREARDFGLGSFLVTALYTDGETLWAADYEGGVYAYRLLDGERLEASDLDEKTMAEAGNGRPAGLWSDGATMWVADQSDRHVYAYRLSDGARESGKEFALIVGDVEHMTPFGLWSDGETVLATDWLPGIVRGYTLAGGARQSGNDIGANATANDYAAGLWSDGETLWVVDENEQKAYAYAAPGLRKPPEKPEGVLSELMSSRALVVPSGMAAGPPVSIPDPGLRGRIAAALGKRDEDPIGVEELAALVVLDARRAGVTDLTGIEDAVNLEGLDLGHNPLTDLRPLSSLTALLQLNLDGTEADLRALAALHGLKELSLRSSALSDVWPLPSMTGLEVLDLAGNGIDDLAALAALANLRVLDVSGNGVAELSPLAGLERLRELHVGGNVIEDFSPLAERAGLRVFGAEEQHWGN